MEARSTAGAQEGALTMIPPQGEGRNGKLCVEVAAFGRGRLFGNNQNFAVAEREEDFLNHLRINLKGLILSNQKRKKIGQGKEVAFYGAFDAKHFKMVCSSRRVQESGLYGQRQRRKDRQLDL